MTTPSFWQYFTRTANPKQQQAETVMEGVLTAVSVIASGQNPDGTAAPGPTPPTGGAGGDLAGTYPDPTIKASVGLTGSPTATTGTVGDSSTRIATDAFVTTAVNNALAGVNPAVAVQAATTAAGDTSGLTYNNGASGVGATLTGANNTALTVDGFTFTATGQRLLVKDDTQSPSGAFNGVYSVTQVQAALLPLILTRATDFDQPSDMNNTGSIPVVNGTVNALTGWLLVSAVVTVGTDPLVFSQWPQSGTSGQTVLRKFAFTYATPDLDTGAATGITPAVGDMLLAFSFQIGTAWDGITPKGDFLPSGNGPAGIASWVDGPVDMTIPDQAVPDIASMLVAGAYYNVFDKAIFTESQELLVVVSQDGTNQVVIPNLVGTSPATVPVTVVGGTSDLFFLFNIGPGAQTRGVFQVAPGTYATADDLAAALNAATCISGNIISVGDLASTVIDFTNNAGTLTATAVLSGPFAFQVEPGGYADIVASGPAVLPVTVVTGVNDTFVYQDSGGPITWTVAPGTYATADDLAAALNAATSGASQEPTFDSYTTAIINNGGTFTLRAWWPPAAGGVGTVTSGPSDLLVPTTGFMSGQATGALNDEDIVANTGLPATTNSTPGSGGPTGATQGAATLYVLIATPI